uniref:Zinc finger protein RFP-like n=1 Tax=Salvator merianae TaxID=96440 RepID=A0A8D0DFS1_SALMN
MEANHLLGNLSKEASCSLCLEYFKDPVSIPCGHNFCQACINQCWGERKINVSCPQCGQSSLRKSSIKNQQLERIVGIVKRLNLEAGKGLEDWTVCDRHTELQKLFCQDEKIPICLVCSISKEHRHHTTIPAEKAVQDYKEQFQKKMKNWKQKRDKLQRLKLAEEKRCWEYLGQLDNERKKIRSEFDQLHQFLEEQEECLLARLEQLEKEVMKEEKTITSKLSKEISSLSDLLSELEEKCKQSPSEFLPDLKNTISRCEDQKNPQEVEHSPHLEKKLSMFFEKNTCFREILEKFKVKVTLDPDTANPFLILSKDQKSVRLGDKWQDVLDNPERFDTYPCVLGCEGLASGKYYWEVEVGSGKHWAVGFAKESVRRKGELIPCPEEQIWALQQFGDHLEVLTHPVTVLSTCGCPRRIQVFLDYEEHQVAFFNADTSALIHLFLPVSFNQERVFPWVCVWPGTELRLYQ